MSKPTILIADDEGSTLSIITKAFSNECNIKVANDGITALEILKKHYVDIILLDIQMPNMDGFETATLIKQNELIKDIPILFLSAYADDEKNIIKAITLGAKDIIPKYFDLKIIKARIKAHLNAYLNQKELNLTKEQLSIFKEELDVQAEEINLKSEQLNEIQSEFEYLFQTSPIAYIIIDNVFQIRKTNTVASELLSINNLCNKNIYLYNYIINKKDFVNALNKVSETKAQVLILALKFDNIKRRYRVYINRHPFKTNNYKLAFIDIENELQYYETLISLNQKLEDEVHKKNHEIESQSKLALMGEMMGNISHQFKQPLNNLMISTSGLQVANHNDMMKQFNSDEMLSNMMENIAYLSDTVDSFKEFTKDSKEYINTTLKDELTSSLNITSLSLKDNHIELIYHINYDDTVKLRIPKNELPQVIINIINNAKDALKENNIKKPWIKIDSSHDENKALITIEDNAGGIPEDILPKVFDKYFSTKKDKEGSGLGLDMSYKIITKSLGGKIWVENTENGAKFSIELPIVNL